jgi:DNA invertase Pin-like site-specific DNA recombinase
MKAPSSPIAFSYVRFSTPEQAKGDSLRRQTEAASAWCAKNHVTLDESLRLHDLGKSAYTGAHRKNPDRHALACFLKLVEDGKVPRGSYLIIENLDRLSREDERPALRLWMDLLDAGVNIVQLTPETIFRHEKSDMFDIMRAVMELARGHGESARKSERNGASWQNKVALARKKQEQPPRKKDGRITRAITGQLPAWVEDQGGKLVLIPERAAVVKTIFHLAAIGYGLASIVAWLTKNGVPAWGPSGVWVRVYVGKILKDRRAVGEHQPRGQGGQPDGDPIANYFPAAVTEDEWRAARAGAAERKRKPGRLGKHVNLFASLLRDARGRLKTDTYFETGRAQGRRGQRLLVNMASAEGRAPYVSFPATTFEEAILSLLAEIDPREILNGDHGPDESLVLAGELARVEGRIGEMEAALLADGDVLTLAKALKQLEGQKRELAAKLAEARQKAAHPLSESWGQAQSLLATLDAAPDPTDARLRLRSSLRRMVEEIWLLIVPRGRDRLCAVQIYFQGSHQGEHRDFLIFHRAPWGNARARRAGQCKVASLASACRPGELDLRKSDHATRLEKTLAALDLQKLEAALAAATDLGGKRGRR